MKKIIALIVAVLFVFAVASISIAEEKKAAEPAKKEAAPAKTTATVKANGEVKAVDAAANSITITRKKGDLTVVADKDTVIKVGKEKKTLADVKVGDKATVMYSEKDGKNVAKSITVSAAKKAEKKAEPAKKETKKEEKKAEPAKKPATGGY
ncbi:MAG: hypothetical protein HY754_00760 [Nitrospirae bacterium]|nr:hypothetical protein [Nitrospirota bacterium]